MRIRRAASENELLEATRFCACCTSGGTAQPLLMDEGVQPMEASVLPRWKVLIVALLVAGFAAISRAADERSAELRLPSDVTYSGAEGSPGPVIFSHTTHVPLADNRCIACHPAPFSILGPTRQITHEEMNKGLKCGTCHDGTKASGVQDACNHCHRMGDGS
jgi:c(7)-type cytochrome triheme protein